MIKLFIGNIHPDTVKELTKHGRLDGSFVYIEPTLAEKILNVAKATGRVMRAVFTKEPVRRTVEESERLQHICRNQNDCYNPDNDSCKICGCDLGIPILNKTRWATETCPRGLWKKEFDNEKKQ